MLEHLYFPHDISTFGPRIDWLFELIFWIVMVVWIAVMIAMVLFMIRYRNRPGRKAGALVILVDGQLVLYVERGGKTLLSWTSDPALLDPAAAALAEAVRDGALGRLTVERADGAGVYDSPLARALEAAGFRPTPRGLRLRG